MKFLNYLKLIRLQQWIKNLLIFFPILITQEFNNPIYFLNLSILFISFSFCSSSIYIINDYLDIESDKLHPIKKNRPLAKKVISVKNAFIVSTLMLCVSLLIGFYLGANIFFTLFFYFIIGVIYSLYLKKIVIIDCFILAFFFTLRILAGSLVINIYPSTWLLPFSIFFFLSLGFAKRFVELKIMEEEKKVNFNRGYNYSDSLFLLLVGICSGFASVIIFALYLNSETVFFLYLSPEILLISIPILLFWINWIWITAYRGGMIDDPLSFAIKDKTSLIMLFLLIIIFTLANNLDFK